LKGPTRRQFGLRSHGARDTTRTRGPVLAW
jgi:hypothetical protein